MLGGPFSKSSKTHTLDWDLLVRKSLTRIVQMKNPSLNSSIGVSMFFISPSKPNFIPDHYVRFYCHHYIIIYLSLLIVPSNHSDNLSFQMHTTSFKENGNTLERFLVTPQRNTLPIKNYLLSLNTLVFFFQLFYFKSVPMDYFPFWHFQSDNRIVFQNLC